ncbi:MAG: hypothetical protein PWQ88_1209 [Candidatus Methanomethylophilaceae archaeon]|nr:hypothetical protein [Candidatus Methanomethylophilaceae archaeon]MDI3541501.1 hypothetical protein [Candidatus Methanomethylophilaceae archaeon]
MHVLVMVVVDISFKNRLREERQESPFELEDRFFVF